VPRPRSSNRGYALGLDSLVDIVSNNVGILVILAVFMALFAIMNPAKPTEQARRPPLGEPPPERIEVPWSHATNKNMVLFSLRRNRLQHFDMRAFFRDLGAREPGQRPAPVTVEAKGLTVRFFPVTNQVYCLEFSPHAGAGETWLEAQRPGSDWRETLGAYPREGFIYYFWVTGDSFELFREVRRRLWQDQVEVGWKPVTPDSKPEICNGFEGSTTFQPQ